MIESNDKLLPQTINVIELRNYLLKPGTRDQFINYFEEHLIHPQQGMNGYPVGQYTVKGYDDNFFWIRGFRNMEERSAFLPAFYYGDVWNEHRTIPNSMILNNDNVHLLRPMILKDNEWIASPIKILSIIPDEGIVVVDFFIANTKRKQLLEIFAKSYLPLLKKCGVDQYTLWTCEPEANDFPRLPVFQDKDLLVMITFYKDESTYDATARNINSIMTEELNADLHDAITIKNTLILYPTKNTMRQT